MKSWSNLLLIITILGSSINSFAQEEKLQEVELKKNAIYGSVGFMLMHVTGTVYYERIKKLDSSFSTFANVGIGRFANWNGDGGYSTFKVGLLSGLKKHHLELGVGAGFNWPKFGSGEEIFELPFTNITKFGLAANIGYRFQKPQENFMFRIGASFPETLYIGFGVPF